MRKIAIVLIALTLTGCATTKINKAYDEGYAKGVDDGRRQMAKNLNSDIETIGEVNEQLRKRLADCQEADRDK